MTGPPLGPLSASSQARAWVARGLWADTSWGSGMPGAGGRGRCPSGCPAQPLAVPTEHVVALMPEVGSPQHARVLQYRELLDALPMDAYTHGCILHPELTTDSMIPKYATAEIRSECRGGETAPPLPPFPATPFFQRKSSPSQAFLCPPLPPPSLPLAFSVCPCLSLSARGWFLTLLISLSHSCSFSLCLLLAIPFTSDFPAFHRIHPVSNRICLSSCLPVSHPSPSPAPYSCPALPYRDYAAV